MGSTKQSSRLRRTNIFPWSCIPGVYSKTVWNKQRYCWQLQNHVWIQNFRSSENLSISSWSCDMEGHAKKCVERYYELANKTTQQLFSSFNSMHWRPSFQRGRIEIRGRIVKRMLSNCSEMLKLGTYWKTWYSVVCEQTCTIDHKMDQSLWQTIISFDLLHLSYMWFYTVVMWQTAKQCRLGLFQDSHFAGDLEDSKSTSGGTLCIWWSHTFFPISWMCKKHTSGSHSSTESEIISLDAGLRLGGINAFVLWDLIVAVLGNTNQSHKEREAC